MAIRSLGAFLCSACSALCVAAGVGQRRDAWSAGFAWTLAIGMLALAAALWPTSGRPLRMLAVAVAVIAIGVPAGLTTTAYQAGLRQERHIGCIDAAHALGVEILTYSADHDERLPLAMDWRTASEVPLNSRLKCPEASAPWTYALNSAVAAEKTSAIASSTALVFEASAYGPNAAGGHAWFSTRHEGRGTVLDATGGARLESPKEVRWKP